MSKHENIDVRVPINSDSLAIKRDNSKCILCGNCRSVCKYSQGVYERYELEENNDRAICIDCGQCLMSCPKNAICEVKDYDKVKKILEDKEKMVIFQLAPAVRVTLGEEFNLGITNVDKKIVNFLRQVGASYVFDTTYGADITVMEEANELLERISNNTNLPLYTSCCPAWVKFSKIFYPEIIPNLSTCKSPICMMGSLIKKYFSKKMNIEEDKIVNVAITPCTAKKDEIKGSDIDYAITTRELAAWIKESKIDFKNISDSDFDFLSGSGAGVIFGASSGVMEATLRTLYYYITGEDLEKIEFHDLRGIDGIKEAKVNILDYEINVAIVNGTGSFHEFIKLAKEKHYDFVEVMACKGGCIAGGGQIKEENIDDVKMERSIALYNIDREKINRYSYKNEMVISLYKDLLQKPGSDISLKLLHTKHEIISNVKVKENICL